MSLAEFGLLAVATSNLLPDGAAQLATLPPYLAEVMARENECSQAVANLITHSGCCVFACGVATDHGRRGALVLGDAGTPGQAARRRALCRGTRPRHAQYASVFLRTAARCVGGSDAHHVERLASCAHGHVPRPLDDLVEAASRAAGSSITLAQAQALHHLLDRDRTGNGRKYIDGKTFPNTTPACTTGPAATRGRRGHDGRRAALVPQAARPGIGAGTDAATPSVRVVAAGSRPLVSALPARGRAVRRRKRRRRCGA